MAENGKRTELKLSGAGSDLAIVEILTLTITPSTTTNYRSLRQLLIWAENGTISESSSKWM
jgi:hypothetical protein